MVADDVKVPRYSDRDELPIFIPKGITREVLRWVQGFRLTGSDRLPRAMAKLLPTQYWKRVSKQTAQLITS